LRYVKSLIHDINAIEVPDTAEKLYERVLAIMLNTATIAVRIEIESKISKWLDQRQ